MKKFYSKFLLLICLVTGTTTFAQIDPPCLIPGATLCDNIDSYIADDPLGPGASWWTTWSGTEGGAEDGTVSTDQAFSGANSVLIPEGGVTDVILKLGNQTTGTWKLEWQMFVPAGKMAYYNIQESETPGVAWNLELYFGDLVEGEGEFTVPAAGPTFTYPVGEWFLVQHIINLDDDVIDVYIDEVLVLSDVYTGSIGGIDFYSASATNQYYVDDVLLTDVLYDACAIPDAVFCDNIDTYGTGDYIGPYAEWWTTWSGVEGTAEDGIVSDDYAFAGPNSMLIPEGGVTDVILKLGDLSTGTYRLEWQMYIPAGSHGYYNIQETEIPGVAWNLELMFGTAVAGEGTVSIPAGGPTFSYPEDAWFLVEHVINLDDNTIDLSIDGALIYSAEYLGNMGGVDFYSIDGSNRYYIDDVLLIEQLAAEPCAIPDAVFCDNIDTYDAGDYIGPYADWWTTWSGVEGTAEDGTVSDDYAFTGSNSMLIPEGGVTDVILKLGNLSTGTYRLEWQMYIPAGSHGYYNIQETEIPGVAWNLELMFGTDVAGEGLVSIPAGGPSFSYPEDAWFLVEHVINLDDNTIDLSINGALIYSAEYLGNMGGVDFYSIDGSNRYYIDDVLLIEELGAVPCAIPGAILCDNIDTYDAGSAIGPFADWWTTWSGVEGTAEDGTVSADYANSGANSMLIPEGGVTDVILKLGNASTGNYRLEWQMYIPAGSHGYYNIQETEIPGVAWNLELMFGTDVAGEGLVSIPAGGPAFTYPEDAWFLIEHYIDLDANLVVVTVNGIAIYGGPYAGNVGGIDFYSIDASNRYYIDDVLWIESTTDINTYYIDEDGDGYGDIDVSIIVIGGAPTGYVDNSTDCDDQNAAVYPGATEITNGIDDDCDELVDENVAIDEIWSLTSIHIYPVPSEGLVTLDLGAIATGETLQLEIYNSYGQLIHSDEIILSGTQITKTINLEMYASGVYQMHLISGTNVISKQLVIQR